MNYKAYAALVNGEEKQVSGLRARYFAAPKGQAWLAELSVGQVSAGQVVQIKPN
jgi:hypothetical protein